MAPRRSARLTANPKPSEQALGKTKVTKPKSTSKTKTTKSTSKTKTTKSTSKSTTTTQKPTAVKTFPCGCAAACNFKLLKKDRRVVLGRPDFNENPTVQCACKVHYKCAKRWATAHNVPPAVLPCGCKVTKRGADFCAGAVAGRRAEMIKEEEKKKEEKMMKLEMEKKRREEMWADVDSGSDLTDLED
jgi:hypothetical protein